MLINKTAPSSNTISSGNIILLAPTHVQILNNVTAADQMDGSLWKELNQQDQIKLHCDVEPILSSGISVKYPKNSSLVTSTTLAP